MSGLSKLRKRDVIVGTVFILAIFGKFAYKAYQQIEHSPAVKISFAQARVEHQTKLLVSKHLPSEPLPPIHRQDILEHTSYEGPLGTMGAIATPLGEKGAMKPAVIWVNGGFSGTDTGDSYDIPTNDQGIASFLDRDIIIFKPTLRGMHENPGVFECFYGEVDDIVAAVVHVSKRQDVDPERIYLMGHSTGGTNVLLASLLTDIPAGIVSFGGAPDLRNVYYDLEPYDINDSTEIRLRSAILYTKDIKVPVLYIEGESSSYSSDALKMEEKAHKLGIDFNAAIIQDQDHFSVLRPVKDLLAKRIQSGETNLPSPKQVRITIEKFYSDPTYKMFMILEDAKAAQIETLLNAGADPNAKDDYGWAALEIAAQVNTDPAVVTVIINAGVDVNQDWGRGWTTLMNAARYNKNPDVAIALVAQGAQVNAQNENGFTALMLASSVGTNAKMVEALIKNGADVNIVTEHGESAIFVATQHSSSVDLVKTLVNAGADIEAIDSDGTTVLVYAAAFSLYPQVISALVELGVDVNVVDQHGFTALMAAANRTQTPEVINILLDAGANAKLKSNKGKTALDYAKDNEALNGTKALELLEQATN